MRFQIWPLLPAVAAGASAAGATFAPARHMALTANIVPPSLASTLEALPSSSITGTSTFKALDFAIKTGTQDAASHVLVEDTTGTGTPSTNTPQKDRGTDKSPAAAEPDASLQIAFLVLGLLLALASVAVALFFGYKQLNPMRIQTNTGSNDVHDSGNDVNLEMGPVTGDASDGVGAATNAAGPNSPPSSA
ncbi:hypothetical protein Q7P36_005271 [Cladosporium allicinum]